LFRLWGGASSRRATCHLRRPDPAQGGSRLQQRVATSRPWWERGARLRRT
jgi:hypothetical protein